MKSENSSRPVVVRVSNTRVFKLPYVIVDTQAGFRMTFTVVFVLKKCQNKFDCLVNEMLLIKQLRPCLNVQSDSIRAKVFV